MERFNWTQNMASQDPRLIEAVLRLCEAVKEEPADKTYASQVPRALIVGGFTRDFLLGLEPKDADVEVFGVAPERLEVLVRELFPEQVDFVGQAFGVLKVHLEKGLEFDISIPRRESKIEKGHKGFSIESQPGLSFEDAARRRDFTINAISLDPLTGEIIDPFDGRTDLKKRVLRVVDPLTFRDDPLRVYRAVQFKARFDFSIDPASFTLLKELVAQGALDELSKERVTEEIKKLFLRAEKPSIGFELMRELGIIARDYPELAILAETPQEPEWHPEGDVWVHTFLSLDQAAQIIRQQADVFDEEQKLQIMIGTLCHDLGKPATTQTAEKKGVMRIRSLGHQEAGEEPARMLCEHWTFGATIIHAARMGAMFHLRPWEFWFKEQQGELNEERYTNAVRKLLKKSFPLSWEVLLAISEADFRGRGLPNLDTAPFEQGMRFREIVAKYDLDLEPTKPLILGRDLMEHFGLKPGVEMGKYIKMVEEARDEGTIKTKEEALELLKKKIVGAGR
jgi:tRNA nucleotidyltransferase (CCA-adding enzyme)